MNTLSAIENFVNNLVGGSMLRCKISDITQWGELIDKRVLYTANDSAQRTVGTITGITVIAASMEAMSNFTDAAIRKHVSRNLEAGVYLHITPDYGMKRGISHTVHANELVCLEADAHIWERANLGNKHALEAFRAAYAVVQS